MSGREFSAREALGTDEWSGRFYAWLAAVGVGILVGLLGAGRVLVEGTTVLGISSQLPWGILISTYVFFALASTGVCIGITSLASVFHIETYEPLVKRGVVLSLAALAAGGLVIMLGLGRPLRAIPQMLLSPNPSAPMWWMIVFYSIYGAALVAEFSIYEWNLGVGSRVKLGVGVAALVAPVLAGGMLGAIFGTAEARPYYGGLFASVYMLATAVLSGVALIAAVTIVERTLSESTRKAVDTELVTDTLAKYLGVMAAVGLLLAAARILFGVTATNEAVALAHQELLSGSSAVWTVGVGVVAGLVAPLALMAYPQTRTTAGVFVASVLALGGLFASRLEFVVGGQIAALTNDPSLEYPVASYTPTLTELAVVVFGFAVFALLYTVGRQLFDLDALPAPESLDVSRPQPSTEGSTGGDDDD